MTADNDIFEISTEARPSFQNSGRHNFCSACHNFHNLVHDKLNKITFSIQQLTFNL